MEETCIKTEEVEIKEEYMELEDYSLCTVSPQDLITDVKVGENSGNKWSKDQEESGSDEEEKEEEDENIEQLRDEELFNWGMSSNPEYTVPDLWCRDRDFRKCPLCPANISRFSIARHLKGIHNNPGSIASQVIKEARNEIRKKAKQEKKEIMDYFAGEHRECFMCGCPLERQRMVGHFRTRHGISEEVTEAMAAMGVNLASFNLMTKQCQECGHISVVKKNAKDVQQHCQSCNEQLQPTGNTHRCALCKMMPTTSMSRHLKVVHNILSAQERRTITAGMAKKRPCPVCNSEVHHLYDHMRRKHKDVKGGEKKKILKQKEALQCAVCKEWTVCPRYHVTKHKKENLTEDYCFGGRKPKKIRAKPKRPTIRAFIQQFVSVYLEREPRRKVQKNKSNKDSMIRVLTKCIDHIEEQGMKLKEICKADSVMAMHIVKCIEEFVDSNPKWGIASKYLQLTRIKDFLMFFDQTYKPIHKEAKTKYITMMARKAKDKERHYDKVKSKQHMIELEQLQTYLPGEEFFARYREGTLKEATRNYGYKYILGGLALYLTMLNGCRTCDLANLHRNEVINAPFVEEDNRYIIVVFDHNGQRAFGDKPIVVTPAVFEDIRRLVNFQAERGLDYPFAREGGALPNSNYINDLTRSYGRSMGYDDDLCSHLLRVSVSEHLVRSRTEEEQEEIARFHCHSRKTQKRSYGGITRQRQQVKRQKMMIGYIFPNTGREMDEADSTAPRPSSAAQNKCDANTEDPYAAVSPVGQGQVSFKSATATIDVAAIVTDLVDDGAQEPLE